MQMKKVERKFNKTLLLQENVNYQSQEFLAYYSAMFDQQSKRVSEKFNRLNEHGLKTSTCALHQNQKIKYICLEVGCKSKRIICKQCVNESHRKHKIGIIDKLIEPLNRLSMNSTHEEAQSDYYYLQAKIQSIATEWNKVQEIFIKTTQEIEKGIIFQLTSILKTFTSEDVDQAEEIMLQGESENELIEEYVAKINFLNKDCMRDTKKVKQIMDSMVVRAIKDISFLRQKTQKCFKRICSHINEKDFFNYDNAKDSLQNIQNEKSKTSLKTSHQKPKEDTKNLEIYSESDDQRTSTKNGKKVKEQQPESITKKIASQKFK